MNWPPRGTAVAAADILDVAGAGDAVEKHRRYVALVSRFQRLIERVVPPMREVAVVSKGDRELLRFDQRKATHFPRDPSGGYAGWHPASGAHAVELVEAARADGADYLAFPATALWWLESYADLALHLRARYRVVAEEDATGVIFELISPAPAPAEPRVDGDVEQVEGLVSALVPGDARILVLADGGLTRFRWPAWRPDRLKGPHDVAGFVAALDHARRDADFLVIPATRDPSPVHEGLVDAVRSHGRRVLDHRRVCAVYDLRDGASPASATDVTVRRQPGDVDTARHIRNVARLLVPRGAPAVLVLSEVEIAATIEHSPVVRLQVTSGADATKLIEQVELWRQAGVAFLIVSARARKAFTVSEHLDRLDDRYRCRWADSRCTVHDLTAPRRRPRRRLSREGSP